MTLSFACSRNSDYKTMEVLRSKKFNLSNLPINDSIDASGYDNAYKFIYYADSTICSTCLISTLDKWNSFIDSTENKYKIKYIFIVNPKYDKLWQTQLSVRHSTLIARIYIDSMGNFRKSNPQIPDNHKYHTMLIDSTNNVVLVGNPLDNTDIRTLFLKILGDN